MQTACDLCGEVGDCTSCYVRIQTNRLLIGAVEKTWVTLSCSCCEKCHRKGQIVSWVHGLAFLFVLPLCAGLSWVLAALTIIGIWLFAPAPKIDWDLKVVVWSVWFIVSLLFFIILLIPYTFWRLVVWFLGNTRDEAIKLNGLITEWGLFTRIEVYRSPPAGQIPINIAYLLRRTSILTPKPPPTGPMA